MLTTRMNLCKSTEEGEVLKLTPKFKECQRRVRNIALYDDIDDEDFPQAEKKMKEEYKRIIEKVKLNDDYIVRFDIIPDYQTGYGHLNIALLNNNGEVLLENEAISDGLGGEREIVFDPNRCYDITELGKKVLGDDIIKFKVEL